MTLAIGALIAVAFLFLGDALGIAHLAVAGFAIGAGLFYIVGFHAGRQNYLIGRIR